MNRLFLFGFLSLDGLLGALTTRAELLYSNGLPDHMNGHESTHWMNADDFTFGTAARLENVRFWTFEFTGRFEGSIVWQIYSNAEDNTPGTLLFDGSSTNLTHVATGFSLFSIPEYVTTFDIAPVSLPAGTYWLALHNGPLTNNTTQGVYWETTSPISRGLSCIRGTPLDSWSRNTSDCAFQLSDLVPRITAFTFSDRAPKVSFNTTGNHNYRVDYKNSLTDASWTPVSGADVVPGTGGVVEVSDPDPAAGNLPGRFYRVALL